MSQRSGSTQLQGRSGPSDSLTRGVVVQRKSPGMEGSREVERALADNRSMAGAGKPELKNKNLFLCVYGSQNGWVLSSAAASKVKFKRDSHYIQ